MNKKTRMTIVAMLLLLAIALYFIAGTYARYTTDFTGTGSVQVAKWNVLLKNGDEDAGASVNLKLTPETNEYVAKERIAPQTTVKGEVTVDLTGTEVAVDLTAKIEEDEKQNLATALGVQADDLEVSIEATGANAQKGVDGEYTIALPEQSAFTAENGKVTVTVKITWTNNEGHNAEDTQAGTKAASSNVNVTLTAKQHIKS